jgi:hypothetical protein
MAKKDPGSGVMPGKSTTPVEKGTVRPPTGY